jgi:hypothetical protein
VTAFTPGEALPSVVLELVGAIADGLPGGGADVREQAAHATVTSGSATQVEVLVPAGSARLGYPDGPLPVAGTVLDERGGLAGEVLVWVGDGLVTGLEQSWYTDEPPTDWPPLDRVRVE